MFTDGFIAGCSEQNSQNHKVKTNEDRPVDKELVSVPLSCPLIIYLIDIPQVSYHTGEKEHHQTEDNHSPVGKHFKTVPRAPLGYDAAVSDYVGTGDGEVAAEEEGGHGSAQKDWSNDPVEEEKDVVGFAAEDIAFATAVFVAYCLHHETEKYEHPDPVGT